MSDQDARPTVNWGVKVYVDLQDHVAGPSGKRAKFSHDVFYPLGRSLAVHWAVYYCATNLSIPNHKVGHGTRSEL